MKIRKWQKLAAAAAMAVLMTLSCALTGLAATKVGTLDQPSNLYWSNLSGKNESTTRVEKQGSYARWDKVDNAASYLITLYRYNEETDSRSTVKSEIKTGHNYFNMKPYLVREGSYVFKVKAVAGNQSKYRSSDWSEEESDQYYVDEEKAKFYADDLSGQANPFAEGPSMGGNTPVEPEVQGPNPAAGEWLKDEIGGWWYRRADGTYPVNEWFQDADGAWYFFNDLGYMQTGWIKWEGKMYFCDLSATPSGSMVTGTRQIGTETFTFDASGALVQ